MTLAPTKSQNEQAMKIAKTNGCEPFFQPGFGWVCDCHDGLHFCDQQCSLISLESAKRKRK